MSNPFLQSRGEVMTGEQYRKLCNYADPRRTGNMRATYERCRLLRTNAEGVDMVLYECTRPYR